MKPISPLAFFLASASVILAAEPTALRAWKSSTGTTLEAKATGIQNDTVTFEGAGGRIVKVPLDKLAEEDRKTLQDHFGVKAAAAGAPVILAHPLGATAGPIAAGNSNYYVYLPKSLKAARKYPMLFYTSSGGGDAGTLNALKEGAEMCGWVIACSVESKNGNDESFDHAKRCVNHLKTALPIDPKRVYFSGNSGGAREAFHSASELEGAGVLAQIAGAKTDELKKGTPYFFISGAYDFNRYDTSRSYAAVTRSGTIRFHPGGHGNGPDWLLTEGMVWLETQWQRKTKDTGPARSEFETAALAWMQSMKTSEPHRAAWWANYFTEGGVLPVNQTKLAALKTGLSTDPKNAAYIQGIADLEKLSASLFAEQSGASLFEHTSPDIQKRVDKLLEQHSATPWIKDVLEGMKKKTDKA